VGRDWRDERIEELEAQLRERDAQLRVRDQRAAEFEQQVASLLKQVAELSAKLGQNSANSHLPPSTDSPDERRKRRNKNKAKKKERTRGAQKGHAGASRELLPADKVSKLVDLFPAECESCWKPLPKVPDASPRRYQHTEIPPVQPFTTEWRRHAVTCPCCGFETRAAFDESQIPASPFGPRLMAIMALLTGVYHLSRRRTVELLSDLLGIRVSLGALSAVEARVSNAVQPAVDAAWRQVGHAEVKHTDGTSWAKAGITMALWTLATTAVTVFKIVADSSKDTLRPLYGALRGILVSDRAKALNFWAMARRQVCWAHLLRKYVSFAERDGPAGALGAELLQYTGLIFDYWHDYKAGKLTREKLIAWMAPVQQRVEALLERAVAAKIAGLSGSCADILAHREALWTFVVIEGVEPTNNHAEREIRAFVMWRKRSFGTQSDRGDVFAENLMTVAHTARKQSKNVLQFLTACCAAKRDGLTPPSLIAAAAT
jgi:transposase